MTRVLITVVCFFFLKYWTLFLIPRSDQHNSSCYMSGGFVVLLVFRFRVQILFLRFVFRSYFCLVNRFDISVLFYFSSRCRKQSFREILYGIYCFTKDYFTEDYLRKDCFMKDYLMKDYIPIRINMFLSMF